MEKNDGRARNMLVVSSYAVKVSCKCYWNNTADYGNYILIKDDGFRIGISINMRLNKIDWK